MSGGWPWPACSPWPASSSSRRSPSGWPTTAPTAPRWSTPPASPSSSCRGPRWRCRWPPRRTRASPSAPRPATSRATAGRWRRSPSSSWPLAAVAAGVLVAVAGPMARVFLSSAPGTVVAALRDTIIAFAPGLVGYALVALLTRALYARGLWKAPTVCVVGGWLLAVAADVVLSRLLPAGGPGPGARGRAQRRGDRGRVRPAGRRRPRRRPRGAHRRRPDRLAAAGRCGSRRRRRACSPHGRLGRRSRARNPGVLAAIGAGVVAGGIVLVIALTVMMGTARGPLAAALRALRSAGSPAPPTDRRCTVAERSPLHGRSIVEVLATSAGGRRHARPLARARGPRRRRHRPRLRRTRDRGALRLPRGRGGLPPGRDLDRAWPRWPTAAPSSSCAGPSPAPT